MSAAKRRVLLILICAFSQVAFSQRITQIAGIDNTQNANPFTLSEMQSARLLTPGKIETTGVFTALNSVEDNDFIRLQNHFGLKMGVGLSKDLNLRLSYEHMYGEDLSAINFFGFGPKVRIIRNLLSIQLPIGTIFGRHTSTSDNWMIQPTALLTIPISKRVGINPSAKWVVAFTGDELNYLILNLGAEINSNSRKWAFRPEMGYLRGPTGNYLHYSLGVSFFTDEWFGII